MGKLSKCRTCCKGAGARWLSLLRLSLHEIRKRKLSYCLGFMACLIAVLVIAITVTIMNHMPAVFFLLGEAQEGECDLIVQTPLEENDVRHPGALRFTAAFNLGVIPRESSPRIQIEAASFKSSVSSTSSRSADIVAFVTELEDSMRLGRKWDYDPIPKGRVFLAKQIARELGASEGSVIYATIPLFPYLRAATQEYCTNTTCSKEVIEGNQLEAINVALRVEEVLKKTYGKVGNSMNRVVFMEYDHFLETTIPYVKDSDISASVKSEILQKWNLRDSATRFMINLSSPRLDHYNHNNYDVIQDKVSKWGAMILYRLGFNQVAPSMPLLLSMRGSRFFSLFMGLIVVMVATILGGLSIILIYSLLMIHVETKTFELGILRMIGMSRLSLVEMVMIHAFLYSIPAWIIGLGLAELLAIAYANAISSALDVEIDKHLTLEAILYASLLGFAIPVIASIFPIRKALTMNLQDSLDTRHSKTKAVEYSLHRADDGGGISASALTIGVVLVLFGVGIYIVFPLALLSFRIDLLLYMFFALLMAMLVGFVLLSLNVENIVERFFMYLLFFWESAVVKSLTLKAFVAHRSRNRKTSIMFSLSLAFVMFIVVSVDLQVKSLVFRIESSQGTRIKVRATAIGALNSMDMINTLENYAKTSPMVHSAAWVSDLGIGYSLEMNTEQAMNMGHFTVNDVAVRTSSCNLLETTGTKYLRKSRFNGTTGFDQFEQLMTPYGMDEALLGSLFEEMLWMERMGEKFLVQTTMKTGTSRYEALWNHPVRVGATLDACPVFDLSKFASRRGQPEVVTSMPTFVHLASGQIETVRAIPWIEFLVDTSDSDAEDVASDLTDLTKNNDDLEVVDYREWLDNILRGVAFLNMVFSVIIVIAMFMCFFSLSSSMYTNINEQSKEIAVLRAIGSGRFLLLRVYVIEAFVLVISASMIGVAIGSAMGFAMVLQRALFTQLPIPYSFPTQQIIVIFVVAIISAFLASAGPTWHLLKQPIVVVLRRLLT
eukprot:TRINITY_DN40584_c0_g1_i1.p1 TRINITY_DN40584_c0_g1~~TRINITY_DN40584_c0_g1_i1.p1  ORF type:complete len:1002 (-),score=203.36 TRINITY_DN40584_c0_g1_i1:2080-5085(-)